MYVQQPQIMVTKALFQMTNVYNTYIIIIRLYIVHACKRPTMLYKVESMFPTKSVVLLKELQFCRKYVSYEISGAP